MKPFQTNKVILLVAAGLVFRALLYYTPQVNTLKIGEPAPTFNLKLTTGEIINSEGLKGRPKVLFFYANWCPCSHNSAALVQKTYEEYREKGIDFISIGIQDTEADLKTFVQRHGFAFYTGIDTTGKISDSFGVITTPTTIIIDKSGKISGLMIGQIKTLKALEERISEVIL